MTKTFEDPNPHISILDDPQTKRQIANQARHALEILDALRTAPPLSEEQLERERFQVESNALAADNALYAAARSASANFLVVPLDGVMPLVKLTDATNDPWQIFNWWSLWPEANPGVALGGVAGVFALRVEDTAAYLPRR